MWMHNQISLVGAEPLNFDRVSEYRGLNSRSIRVSAAALLYFIPRAPILLAPRVLMTRTPVTDAASPHAERVQEPARRGH